MLEDQVIRRVGGVRDMQVDVRVIAASNRDLERAVREGHFRQDLYYRLAIIAIFIPPLRERTEDILPLVDFFIGWYNRKFKKSVRGITAETRRLLLLRRATPPAKRSSWPSSRKARRAARTKVRPDFRRS